MVELDGKQTGSQQQAGVNDTTFQNRERFNTMHLQHYNALTARFGDLTPFLSLETVPDGVYQFGNNHELRTLTLGGPLLSPVRVHKNYYHVPMKVLLPETFELLLKNPKFGDDLPDSAKPYLNIISLQSSILQYFCDITEIEDYPEKYTILDDPTFWKSLALMRNLFSCGGLFKMLGYPNPVHDFDLAFDELVTKLFDFAMYTPQEDNDANTLTIGITTGNRTFDLKVQAPQADSEEPEAFSPDMFGRNSVTDFFNLLESGYVTNLSISSDIVALNEDEDNVLLVVDHFRAKCLEWLDALDDLSTTYSGVSYSENPYCVNFCKLLGYHLVSAQFFTNDNVDDLENSKRYLQNLRSIGMQYVTTETFTVDGVSYRYDVCSNNFLTEVLSSAVPAFDFWFNLLTFEQSLKFGDYFNGSRLTPLAVGDVHIDVNTSGGDMYVETLDVSRNLAKQRFLNAVSKLSSNIAQYTKGIFGTVSAALDPTPQFVGRSTTLLGNPETINTSDDQGKITSEVKSIDGKFEFRAQFKDFGYLYGILSFDVIPCYPFSSDRQLLHRDRFELFNPMLQNIGDQPVYGSELTSRNSGVFGYQQRYAEYKQAVNVCSGGFSLGTFRGESPYVPSTFYPYGLASWLYQADTREALGTVKPLNSEFIRHERCDFDRFFKQMDGASLATYFHFAIIFNNQLDANLPMQYQSTIL